MKKNKKRFHKRSYTVWIVLASLLAMTAAAFVIAQYWQASQEAALSLGEQAEATTQPPATTQPATTAPTTTVPLTTAPTAAPAATTTQPSIAATEPAATGGTTAPASSAPHLDTDNVAVADGDSEFLQRRRESFSYALPENEKVPASYFDDAIFFGDSISTGIPLYNVMPNAKVVAFTGIGTFNVATKECIMTNDGRKTLLDAAKEYGDKAKVYIMLGGNGLASDKESFIADYRAFLQQVKGQYPNAVIYIQTMTPVTDDAHKTYPSVSNAIIEEYNLAIQDMAKAEGLPFLDVASALMDEKGRLPAQASPVDGMHFSAEYYAKWFAYLRTHTVTQ